jgi:hypothetical protein
VRFMLLCAALFVANAAPAIAEEPSDAVPLVDAAAAAAVSTPAADRLQSPAPETGPPQAASTNIPLPSPRPERTQSLTTSELCHTAAAVAVANNLPVAFFINLIHQESGFRAHVVSPAGAEGIAQFMPRVAVSYGLADSFEPIAALTASGKLLSELVAQFGNLGLAAAAYNAGPRRVQDWLASRGNLPTETRQYVYSITGHAAEHWAGQTVTDSELRLPVKARCAETTMAQASDPVLAGLHNVPTVSSSVPASGVSGLGVGIRPDKVRSFAARRSMPQPSQFAIGRPVSPLVRLAEQRYLRSARAKANSRREPAMSRFLAMATPVIMAEEKATRR